MKASINPLSANWLNLASEPLGSKVLFATDDFFAEKENLLKEKPAVFLPDAYTDRGKWMDGWESRRKRVPGHDYAIIQLGLPGHVHGLDIDTSFFLGNHPPEASVEACYAPGGEDLKALERVPWTTILERSALGPGQSNLFELPGNGPFSHLRLRIFPDGGVARLRVYGRGAARQSEAAQLIDLASAAVGGLVAACNDMFFSPKDNLIMPYASRGMNDGWETRRRRTPGHDWSILSLGLPGVLKRVELDTAFFKGNYPDRFSLEAVAAEPRGPVPGEGAPWEVLIPETKLQADQLHLFDTLQDIGPVTHVRLNIYPDGGVARLRCYGEPRRDP